MIADIFRFLQKYQKADIEYQEQYTVYLNDPFCDSNQIDKARDTRHKSLRDLEKKVNKYIDNRIEIEKRMVITELL